MPFEQTILFLFGLCSILLYYVIIVILKKHTRTSILGGTFFRLVVTQFYADTFFFIEFSITMRFRKYTDFYTLFEPGFQLNGLIPRIISGVHYYIKMVVYVGYIIFAVNRLFTAITVQQNISVWSSRTLGLVTMVQWTIPVIGIIPTHFWPDFSFYLLVTPTAMRLNNDEVSTALIAYIDGGCCLFTCLFCMVCYIVTGYYIRKNWKRSLAVVLKKSNNQSTAERGLFISAVLSFSVLMLNLTIQMLKIVISFGGMINIFSVYDISYPMMDLMYSHYPWVLIVTSSVLRRQLIYDVKFFIKNVLNLDEVSMSMSRGGQTNMASRTAPS